MLRIEKSSDGQTALVRLSGRIQSEHLQLLRVQIDGCAEKTILNLEEVALVDHDAVRFLGRCESNGIELLQCPLYVREWILKRRPERADE
jgi:hypothetical protein